MSEIPFAGRYSLEKEIGHGSTARIFLARQEKAARRVAVKVLEGLESGQDLRPEARKIAGFSHRNIVRVYDMGKADFEGKTVPYVAMEHVHEGDLMCLIERRKRLPEGEALRIGADIAAALAHAHARGVVHEDVKPENILMKDLRRAKLTDFNVVRALGPGGFSGAPRYAAPESLQGESLPAGDVYSLGVTLYQMVVGGPPFRGRRRDVMRQHAEEAPVQPIECSPISEELNVTILSCLEKDPALRPSANGLRKKLREIDRRAKFRSTSKSVREWVGRVVGR